jgi:phenylalanyl-tRNA synthetase beta chain
MKLSTTWLNDYIDVQDITPQRLADALTNAGLEVEGGIESTGIRFKHVIVAKVLALSPHPNADKLRLVSIDCGAERGQTQVVCGAPNVAEGQRIAFALNGATVFSTKQNAWFTLTPAVIRGVESQGMVCSLEELALTSQYESTGGIWVLNDIVGDDCIGQALEVALGLEADRDAILETAPTANRGDWMSYWGVAREVSALFERPLKSVDTLAEEELETLTPSFFSIHLEDESICSIYLGASLEDVKVAPSPLWLVKRLEASGIRSINNVVDITNFVMLETGQPLHAFDASKLGLSGRIGVRRAKAGESLNALDENTYSLNEAHVVVTCQDNPVALAGVMGGEDSCIDESSTSVFLEAAFFPSATTRRSAREAGIRTESSARFERGVDAGGVQNAFARAIYLLQTLAGAKLVGISRAGQLSKTTLEIPLSLTHLAQVIGQAYSGELVQSCLARLGFRVSIENEDVLNVSVPSFRQADVQKPIDLIEEVVRIAGYDTIEATYPASSHQVLSSSRRRILNELRHLLTGLGLNEAMTTSLVGETLLQRVSATQDEAQTVALLNSHSSEHTLMRQSILPTLLDACLSNIQQGVGQFNAFEIGRTYFKRGKSSFKNTGVQEKLNLAVILCEQMPSPHWVASTPPDFYRLKGVLETVLRRFDLLESVHFTADTTSSMFHAGRCASATFQGSPKTLATLGQLHPAIQKRLKLKAPVYLMEIDADLLIKTIEQQLNPSQAGLPEVIRLSPFPEMERDLALLVKAPLTHQDVVNHIQRMGYDTLQSVAIFDEYRDASMPADARSLAYRLSWQAPDRTLTDKEVDTAMTAIRQELEKSLGVSLR